MRQSSALPTQKLLASGLEGAVTIVLAGIEIPTEVAQAITINTSIVTGFVVPPAERDSIEGTQ